MTVKYAIVDFETTGLNFDSSMPIEIGIIWLDENLNHIDNYQALISNFPSDQADWNNNQRDAYAVHKIPFEHVYKSGIHPSQVRDDIVGFIKEYKAKDIILISDNAVFDTYFMEWIFGGREKLLKYFHYSTWDLGLLFSIFDVKPKHIHRALADAAANYAVLYDLIKTIQEGEK